MEQAEPMERNNAKLWVVRLFVPIPGSNAMLFGAVDLTALFSKGQSPPPGGRAAGRRCGDG